jgi:transcription elongation factor GreA
VSDPVDRTAAGLLRSVGLLADGPATWGRPVSGRGKGVYLVELPSPAATAPLELSLIGKWLERLPELRLDGERPSSRALTGRLASLWLPEARVVYAGATTGSISARITSLVDHVPGDPRPHPDGQWLHFLRHPSNLRVWWASTDAPEEYLDALLDAFAAAHAGAPTAPDRPATALLLPWANTRRPTGERQASGITGGTLPLPAAPPPPPVRRVDLPPGDADGVEREERGTGTRRRTGNPASLQPAGRPPRAASASSSSSRAQSSPRNRATPVEMSQSAVDRLRQELDELTRVRRPEVVARIKAARELGDLRENAEYHAAREEQSFLEGRVQLLEERLRNAVIVVEPAADPAEASPRVRLGSEVTVELDGEELRYVLVGTAEANAAAGRISTASPVGAALLGARAGETVEVRTPRGAVRYRVVSVG